MKQNYWNRRFDKNKKYIWISERDKTTCEKCQSLNGKIFSGDKVPNRPHPNCKCEVEEYHGTTIQNVPQETHDNPKRVQKLEKQANDLEKQVIILRGEIQKANRIEAVYNYKKMYEKKIKELADVKNLTNKLKKETIYNPEFLTELENANMGKSEKFAFDSTIIAFKKIYPNAAALWNISSSKFTSKNGQKYIKENGTTISKVSDLNNKNLERFIRRKLKEQINTTESRGILFNTNSSLSKEIENDENFLSRIQNYAKNNKNNLLFRRNSKNSTFGGFKNPDLHYALGNVDVINIHLDDMDNLWMLIVDTYDFNKGEKNPLVIIGRKLQEKGLIENYYSIIPVKIPPEKWKTF